MALLQVNVHFELNQEPVLSLEPIHIPTKPTPGKETPQISILSNSKGYCLDEVYIAQEHARYRLVVLREGKLLKNDYFSTPKSARLAFQEEFVKGELKKKVKWSAFYEPEKSYLDDLYYAIEKKRFISLLLSVEYIIETAFIMAVEEGYRGIVINEKVLLDEVFKSFDEASTAFYNQFRDQAHNVKPVWSEFYSPSKTWLDKILSIANGEAKK